MTQESKTETNIGVGIGIILQLAGRLLAFYGGASGAIIGLILMLVGVVFFIWGCMNYAEGKGYTKVLGLLGLFSCIGLLILVFLPDKSSITK